MARTVAAAMAVTAAHFQLQYFEGFFNLKALREKVFLGKSLGGGEYTVPEVRGYPGEELLKSGVVPDDVLKRKCLSETEWKREKVNFSILQSKNIYSLCDEVRSSRR